MKVVVATGNQGKLRELSSLLEGEDIDFLPQSEFNVSEVEETGLSYLENALIKARHCAKISGLPSMADDSGLSVDALGGAPGIYSARYAGEHATAKENIDKLLLAIKNVGDEDRTARFHCVIAFVRHYQDPVPIICHASWEGRILRSPEGEGGFGYDPVFYIPNLNSTAAQLTSEQKNSISHRARALRAFVEELKTNI